jgi:hypothetical protein
MTRQYSSISVETTLASGISSTATSMTVATGTGSTLLGGVTLAPGNVDQFTVAIDPDTISEEIVFITAVSSDTFTIVRNRAGTSGISHSGGATVRHVLTSDDLNYFNNGVDNAVTLTGTQTLTNKNLASGTNTFPSSLVTLTGSQTLSSKTLTSPVINTATANNTVANYSTLKSPQEITTVSATAATGTINFDTLTQAVLYYTTNASGNWTLNIRGDGSTTLNSLMDTGDAITIAHMVTQGATPYYNSAVTIDGSAVTPRWQNSVAPTSGNASGIDVYSYTIIKTASATFAVLASQVKFS